MEENKLALAIKENRCFVCGTEHGKHIKVLENIYIIEVKLHNFIPLCGLCLQQYPEVAVATELGLTHLCWTILEKRLHQQIVYSKICKCGCGTPIVTARKEKEFASNNCRAKYWQRQARIKEITGE